MAQLHMPLTLPAATGARLMKNLTHLFASLLVLAMLMAGCRKKDDPTPAGSNANPNDLPWPAISIENQGRGSNAAAYLDFREQGLLSFKYNASAAAGLREVSIERHTSNSRQIVFQRRASFGSHTGHSETVKLTVNEYNYDDSLRYLFIVKDSLNRTGTQWITVYNRPLSIYGLDGRDYYTRDTYVPRTGTSTVMAPIRFRASSPLGIKKIVIYTGSSGNRTVLQTLTSGFQQFNTYYQGTFNFELNVPRALVYFEVESEDGATETHGHRVYSTNLRNVTGLSAATENSPTAGLPAGTVLGIFYNGSTMRPVNKAQANTMPEEIDFAFTFYYGTTRIARPSYAGLSSYPGSMAVFRQANIDFDAATLQQISDLEFDTYSDDQSKSISIGSVVAYINATTGRKGLVRITNINPTGNELGYVQFEVKQNM